MKLTKYISVIIVASICLIPSTIMMSCSDASDEKTTQSDSAYSDSKVDKVKQITYNIVTAFKDKQTQYCGIGIIFRIDSIKTYNTCEETSGYLSLENSTDSLHYKAIFLPDDKEFREIGHMSLRGISGKEFTDSRYMIRIHNDTNSIGSIFLEPVLENYSPYLSDTARRFMEAIQYFFDKLDKQ